MPRRNYHEKKALRCMQSIISMKRILEKLEGVRVKKIETLNKEIENIQSATVTLICYQCHREFPVLFTRFASGKYDLFCRRCVDKDNREHAKKVTAILDANSVKYKCDMYSNIKIIMPHERN